MQYPKPRSRRSERRAKRAARSARHRTVRAYLATRDKACRGCGADGWDTRLEMHEIQYRSQGGEVSPENSLLLCGACHRLAHTKHLTLVPQDPTVGAEGTVVAQRKSKRDLKDED
jgi:5-methylcytosine-specific restriction endonuclease McrA